jgi:hypothetical protein
VHAAGSCWCAFGSISSEAGRSWQKLAVALTAAAQQDFIASSGRLQDSVQNNGRLEAYSKSSATVAFSVQQCPLWSGQATEQQQMQQPTSQGCQTSAGAYDEAAFLLLPLAVR